jgi:hypothetical protein
MSDKAKEEITLTEEEKETAIRLYNEADKAWRELIELSRKAIRRHLGSSGSKPMSLKRIHLLTEAPIRECDENGKNCYCWERDANGQPGPIRPC